MSATPHTTPSRRHGLDWVVFAALMIALAGVFNVVDGLVALVDSRFYAAGAVYVWSDVRTWGQIVLALGVVELVAAPAPSSAGAWGLWFGISAASLNVLGQMVFIPAYPWWALLIIALDILVIYGLAAYGVQEAS